LNDSIDLLIDSFIHVMDGCLNAAIHVKQPSKSGAVRAYSNSIDPSVVESAQLSHQTVLLVFNCPHEERDVDPRTFSICWDSWEMNNESASCFILQLQQNKTIQ